MEYQNDDIFFQLSQVLGATVDTTTVRAHIVQLMANKNFYVRQNDTLRDDIKTLEGVQSVLSAENRRLKIQVEQLQQTNRQIETMRAKAQRDFEMVADYADRLNTQIGSHSNEINSMQKKLEKAEEDNENCKVRYIQLLTMRRFQVLTVFLRIGSASTPQPLFIRSLPHGTLRQRRHA